MVSPFQGCKGNSPGPAALTSKSSTVQPREKLMIITTDMFKKCTFTSIVLMYCTLAGSPPVRSCRSADRPCFSDRELRSTGGFADILDKNRPRFGKRAQEVNKLFLCFACVSAGYSPKQKNLPGTADLCLRVSEVCDST